MRTARGFTLVEVLITMIVVAAGLLGASSVQMFSLQSTNQGYLRSQATAIAHDMAERIRANPAGVTEGAFTSLATSGDFCATVPDPDCLAGVCSTAELAAYDFFSSGCSGAATLLPTGVLSVNCDLSGTQPLCSIQVQWDQRALSDKSVTVQTLAMRIEP